MPEFRKDVIVAYPRVDQYADFRRLALHHLDSGRRVFAALDPLDWSALETLGQLEGIQWRVVGEARQRVVELKRVGGVP